MTTVDSTELNDAQRHDKISDLARLAWDHVCLVADQKARAADRLAAARRAYGASVQAMLIFRQLAGKQAGRTPFELSRLALGALNCVETRLYRLGGKLRNDVTELLGAEWLLVQVIQVVLYTPVFSPDELRDLQRRVCALQQRAADHQSIIQQADFAERGLRKVNRATVEQRSNAIMSGLDDLDILIEIAIEDAHGALGASPAMTRIMAPVGADTI